MNKNAYLGIVLASCLSVSTPLWTEVMPVPEHPAHVSTPAATPEGHTAAATLHKEHAKVAATHESLAAPKK